MPAGCRTTPCASAYLDSILSLVLPPHAEIRQQMQRTLSDAYQVDSERQQGRVPVESTVGDGSMFTPVAPRVGGSGPALRGVGVVVTPSMIRGLR